MMRKIYFLLIFAITFSLKAQITDLVEPKSVQLNLNTINIPEVIMSQVDLAPYILEDKQQEEQSWAKPYRFGAELDADFSLTNSGIFTELSNGDRIWQLNIVSEGALTINFLLENFMLADGAELFVYNLDRSMKIGPFTSKQNNSTQSLVTWPIEGSSVVIELYEPQSKIGQSRFTVKKVVHGYRGAAKNEFIGKVLNDSEDCNIDASCPLGDDFELQKKSTVMLVVGTNGFCSGTMVNNTAQDRTPYILSANHCFAGEGTQAPVGANANIAFRFNWISETPSCATTINSGDGTFLQTGFGATVRASQGTADMVLLEANNRIPDDWDVVYGGWNRSTADVPSFTTGIHHPSGDIMKICRDNDSPTRASFSFNGFIDRVWQVSDWDQGVTEPGSSGSQLLDNNGLLIGVLSGGTAACFGTTDNGGLDIYGRLDFGWTSVSSFLDPTNSGVTTLDHLTNLNLSTIEVDGRSIELEVFPNPALDELNLKTDYTDTFNYKLYSQSGKLVKIGQISELNNINVSGLISGVYLFQLESKDGKIKTVKKVIIQ